MGDALRQSRGRLLGRRTDLHGLKRRLDGPNGAAAQIGRTLDHPDRGLLFRLPRKVPNDVLDHVASCHLPPITQRTPARDLGPLGTLGGDDEALFAVAAPGGVRPKRRNEFWSHSAWRECAH